MQRGLIRRRACRVMKKNRQKALLKTKVNIFANFELKKLFSA